jgi:AraC family transcriptional regulator
MRQPPPHAAPTSSFTRQMRSSFALSHAPALEARDLRFGALAVVELRYDGWHYGESTPMPERDELLASVQLRTSARHEIVEDGRRLPIVGLHAGMTALYDLRRSLTARSVEPFHSVNFSVPLGALPEAGEERLGSAALHKEERLGVADPVTEALARAILPSLAQPEHAVRLFVDHVLFAMRAHVGLRFGLSKRSSASGGLAPWQERRAKALIDAQLAHNLSLADVARECELSVSQFARAFKRSTGMPPHRFLMQRRLERARELLLHTQQPLAAVASACGFADQSHFTKVFRRALGQSPGAFRAAERNIRETHP